MRSMGMVRLFVVDSWFKGATGQFRLHNGPPGAADRNYVLRCDLDLPTGYQCRGDADASTQSLPRMGRVRYEDTTMRRASSPILGTVNLGIGDEDQPQQFELLNCLAMGNAFGSHIQPGAPIPTGSTEWTIVSPTNSAYAPLDMSTFTWLGGAAPSPGEITLTTTAISENEGDAVVVTATRAGGTDGAASVDWAIGNAALVDETANGTFNWADGEGGAK
jgi:hypothetical protein